MMVYGREGVPMKPSRPGKTDPPAKRYQNLGRSKLHMVYVLKGGAKVGTLAEPAL